MFQCRENSNDVSAHKYTQRMTCACRRHERQITYRSVPHWQDHTVVVVAGAAVAARSLVDSGPWLTRIVGKLGEDYRRTCDGRRITARA